VSRFGGRFGFDPDVIVHCVPQPLRAADVTLSGLHADMSRQKTGLDRVPRLPGGTVGHMSDEDRAGSPSEARITTPRILLENAQF
jgi:hypothetical protein